MNLSPKRYLAQPPEWQAVKTFSEMHLLPAENLESAFSYPKHSVEQTNSQLQAARCSGYVGVSSSQNLGDTMPSRDWQEILNTTFTTYYDPPSLASLLHIQSGSNHAVVEEGAILREFIGRLGGGAGSNGALALSSGPAEGLQSSNFLAANGSWKALDASADESLNGLEPGKGCIEMARSTSHRLTQAISDPEFAGRASRLSTIRDGVCVYLGQPIASLDVEEKNDVRSEASQTHASSLLSLNTLATQTPPLSSATADRTKDNRSWNITSRAELNNKQEFCSDLKLTELERHNFSSRPSTTNQLAEQRASMEVDNKFVEIHSTSAERSLNTEQNTNEQRFPACYGATLRKKRKSTLMEKSEDDYRLTSVSDVKKSAAEATNIKEQQLTESRKNIKEVRMKLERTNSERARNSASVPIEDSSKAPADPPKLDYIHVRARRGQATDSHSLAERVRREKISERMKFLQDLVPGCSKVTGKAVMLDEIINYVQSLQRQVEFLSMKLATVNPSSVDNVFSKEVLQPHDFPTESLCLAPELASIILQRQLTSAVGFDFLSAENGQLNTRLTTMTNAPMLNTYGDTVSQTSSLWDCELQSVIQMGFGSNILPSIGSENIEKL